MREVANPNAHFDPGLVKEVAKLTRNKVGKWDSLVEIIRETIDVAQDGSVAKVIEIP
jgi:hypothetical protein